MGDLYLFQLSGGPMPAAKIIGDKVARSLKR
jgi:hypothetical protein